MLHFTYLEGGLLLEFLDFCLSFGLVWFWFHLFIKFFMEVQVQGRALPPIIPEDGEPELEVNGGVVPHVNGGDAEVPVSKSQRRRSDVKVYKEICDYYAKL